jgi:hypothetical protein
MITQRNLEEFKTLASEIRAVAVQWQARLAPFVPRPDHVIGDGRDAAEAYTDATIHAEIQSITLSASIKMLVEDLDNFLAGPPPPDSRWDPNAHNWRPA